MRWWSFLPGGRTHRWVPVSNVDHDDPDETGMDDLMRMAMGHYLDEGEEESVNVDSSEGCSAGGSADDGAVFRRPYLGIWSTVVGLARGRQRPTLSTESCTLNNHEEESQEEECTQNSSSNYHYHLSDSGNGQEDGENASNIKQSSCWCISRLFCCRLCSRLVFPPRRWYLVLLSLVIPLVFISLNVGLGIYSLVFYNPDQLVIDKSVKSFSIPNHHAYRNLEALMLARKDNSSRGRYKRDLTHNYHERDHSLWQKNKLSKRITKRETLLQKEENMLKETSSILKSLNLKNTNFLNTRSKRDLNGAHTIHSSDHIPSINTGSVTSTLNKLQHRRKRSGSEIDCLFDYQSIVRWKMHVIYLARGDEDLNMFTKERLSTAHGIEQQIIAHPEFHSFCLRDPRLAIYDPAVHSLKGCAPLNSLLTYFYPSKDARGNVFYDGLGTNIDDIDSALKLAMNQETFYYYVDDKINKTYQRSYLLRSEVLFGAPLAGFSCESGARKDQDQKFKDFVVTYIDLLSKVSTDKVQVLYGGNEIFDYEVSSTFWGDVHLAMISLLAIFVLMLVLSLSLYLTVLGVMVIALSFPMSLFFYRVVFGINALGILNGAAAFVIIGIGVDDVFVFVNIYRQSAYMKDPATRIKCTLRTAGVATFFTSFTTAAAFAANLASAIPAVYEFGLFMSLIVSSCWLSVFVLMPPMLYLHACFCEPLEKAMFSCISRQTPVEESRSPGDGSANDESLQQFEHQQEVLGRGLYADDGDVPMLDIAEEGDRPDNDFDPMDDDDMLLIDDPGRDDLWRSQGRLTLGQEWAHHHLQVIEPTNESSGLGLNPLISGNVDYTSAASSNSNNNNMCLGRIIQRCLMFLTNRIVIRGRFFVIGFYCLLLVVSCYLLTRLRPSTHPPQLFNPDTNIQQLLDLKANFSIIDTLHCDRCSGLYKVRSRPSGGGRHHSDSSPIHRGNSSFVPSPLPVPPLPTQSVSEKVQEDSIVAMTTADPNEKQYLPDYNQNNPDEKKKYKNDAGAGIGSVLGEKLQGISDSTENTAAKLLSSSVAQFLSAFGDFGGSGDGDPSAEHEKGQSLQINKDQRDRNDDLGDEGQGQETQEFKDRLENSNAEGNMVGDMAADVMEDLSKKLSLALHGSTTPASVKTSSVDENFDVCRDQSCDSLKDRPLLESGATVYVVFGISGLHRPKENDGHVMDQFKGYALFDPKFAESFNLKDLDPKRVAELCRVCHYLANQTELVKPGSAQCMPRGMTQLDKLLATIPDCSNLPGTQSVYHYQAPAHAEGGWDRQGRLLWLAFAFESTTSEGQAYFEAYKQYLKWQDVVERIKHNVLTHDSPLSSIFQTSEFWTKVMMEVVAVHSAIYGLALSMLICVLAVAVFTGHLVLLLLVVVTILAMICCVVGVFALCGWEMGAVEAVSLSILVGSSVDYLVHIVEGYIIAGSRLPRHMLQAQPAGELRRARTSLAVRHIGVAVVCSALTTVIAAVPLTQTSIQPFAKFGAILLLNTSVSVVMTLTLATALMATLAPGRYVSSWRSHLVAFVVAGGLTGMLVLGIYIAAACFNLKVPGPSGEPLFG